MKPYIFLYTTTVLLLSISSCKKDNSFLHARPNTLINNVGGYSVGDKYQQFNNGSDAVFDISLSHIPYVTQERVSSDFQGSIKAYKTDNLVCGGNINVNSTSFQCSENSYMQKVPNVELIRSYFGKKIDFSLAGSNSVKPFSYSISTPSEIQILHPRKTSGFTNTFVSNNQTINWNEDKSNSNGVLIMVTWNGVTLSNVNGQNSVLNYNIVPDDGSETLSESYFKNIPENGVITVTLMRGNFEYFTNTDGIKYQLIARSESVLNCVLGTQSNK